MTACGARAVMCYDAAMARLDRLPPPPASPARSPAVAVAGETDATIAGLGGGPHLDARVHAPPSAARGVVLCHPHPLYGGSMHSPVPLAIAKALSDHAPDRVAWVRFDFRGVGASEGAFDGGRGEVDDVRAAIEHLAGAVPGAPIAVCGHSFGSWVGLRAAAAEARRVDRVLLVAPSTRFFGFGTDAPTFAGRTTIFVGTEDELFDVDEARALAAQLGADLRVFEGFDHHFLKSRRAMAEAALAVVAPEATNR
ncbi:MAG TPA: alpha/beta fold hydrolase [Polyangiaceae bacterium]|nr:alpha/beta fold hydrolase [Polyangiaceae bacterium]